MQHGASSIICEIRKTMVRNNSVRLVSRTCSGKWIKRMNVRMRCDVARGSEKCKTREYTRVPTRKFKTFGNLLTKQYTCCRSRPNNVLIGRMMSDWYQVARDWFRKKGKNVTDIYNPNIINLIFFKHTSNIFQIHFDIYRGKFNKDI